MRSRLPLTVDERLAPAGDNESVQGREGRATAPSARGWLVRALAFARAASGERPAPSGRSAAADLGLATAAALASLVVVIHSTGDHIFERVYPNGHVIAVDRGFGGISVGAAFFVVATSAPLALRRIRPLTAFWVVYAGTVLDGSDVNTVTVIAIVIAAYSAVVYSPFRGAALISVPAAALIITAKFPDSAPQLPARFGALFVLIPVALFGNAVQVWRRQAGDSQARLRHAQAEHEAATAAALATERTRIAGELHDVVTHNVSVMVVQAGAARRVLAAAPDEATEALLAVEASGRAAMIELQHLLGLLSPVDGMQPHGEEPLRPQPGLDRLQPLIDRLAAAGLPVELTVSGRPRALAPGVDLACYRVVQEALTNVMKHAAQARTTVRLDYRPCELVIDVSDDGWPGGAPPGGPGQPGGRGLLGLRERVSLYGGAFDAGPRPAGGWRVMARLPLDKTNDQPADAAGAGQGADAVPVHARP
jgi:signal transduction histidine kinase